MKFRKALSMLLAMLMLACALPAMADTPLADCFDAQQTLLFSTTNVALQVDAEFALDDVAFKHATLTHRQDLNDSVRELVMETPMKDGTTLRSGFTVVTFASETTAYESGFIVRQYETYPGKFSILRPRIWSDALLPVLRAAVKQMEASLGDGVQVTVRSDGSRVIHVEVGEKDVPETMNGLVTLLALHAAEKYTGTSVMTMSSAIMPEMSSFATIADGLVYCTKSLRIISAAGDITLDEYGNLTECKGNVLLLLQEKNGMLHELSVTFTETADEYGFVSIPRDNPAKYNTWFPAD
ncbi:MAG: hypothetical protein Q4C54_02625 [Clostridia bacterium]|nr:hypothetical protein [Clostridia bacterium]